MLYEVITRLQPGHLIALAVEASLDYVTPAAVFVPTRSGATARSIGRFRPPVWMIAPSPEEKTCQDLQFSSGVHPVRVADDPEDWGPFVREYQQRHPLEGELVLLTSGPSQEHRNTNHRLEIIVYLRIMYAIRSYYEGVLSARISRPTPVFLDPAGDPRTVRPVQ